MVSFQTPVSPNQRKMISQFENSSKKRRWEEIEEEAKEDVEKHSNTTSKESDIELHLEQKPLPLEWQRCLDIQSGKIHFYNTRTQKRTSKDPRQSPDGNGSSIPKHVSLDLELNLPYESLKTHNSDDNWAKQEPVRKSMGSGLSLEMDQPEMVATVCYRCHMLVMLYKSSPSCPSCKFMHPPDHQSPLTLFKRHRLLCCKQD
ncbi:uncharacterized protein LOC122072147 [Macadamia integrifolia]|uniref:uncharacterized protein LOC122072147 n=1 Tax=Macadamia integrifolia TaxID=60698 RepID=UPI001C4F04BC|nr:uncharacterized protein LOC122072147 [Macadamia integrifolia]